MGAATNTVLEGLRSLKRQRLQQIQLSVQNTGRYCHVAYTLCLHDKLGGQVQRLFHSAFWSMNENSITARQQIGSQSSIIYFLSVQTRCATTPLLLDSFPLLIPLKAVFLSLFFHPVAFLCPVLLYNLSALETAREATVNQVKQRSFRCHMRSNCNMNWWLFCNSTTLVPYQLLRLCGILRKWKDHERWTGKDVAGGDHNVF